MKVLKKKFSQSTIKKAKIVAEVLGGEEADYYGLADAYCLSSSEDLIEIAINSVEDVTEKFSSYKVWSMNHIFYISYIKVVGNYITTFWKSTIFYKIYLVDIKHAFYIKYYFIMGMRLLFKLSFFISFLRGKTL